MKATESSGHGSHYLPDTSHIRLAASSCVKACLAAVALRTDMGYVPSV